MLRSLQGVCTKALTTKKESINSTDDFPLVTAISKFIGKKIKHIIINKLQVYKKLLEWTIGV